MSEEQNKAQENAEQAEPVVAQEQAFAGEQDETAPQDQTAKFEEEIARLKDMYMRAMAETENVRARAKRETEDTAKYATTKFARDMVNILENLVRAASCITKEQREGSEIVRQVAEGIDMTVQELGGIFERNGIKRIDPQGEKFDHNFHQAVAQVESTDAAAGTVLQVLQAGYKLHDRLLRPAMVTVATAPAAKADAANNAA
ncbi:MAG TPA: nucleotide exchange factor GrpE [Rickettsiales bacterium]|nr:nucleotide exchange factor GrpE [Rickettsiales bacterium]